MPPVFARRDLSFGRQISLQWSVGSWRALGPWIRGQRLFASFEIEGRGRTWPWFVHAVACLNLARLRRHWLRVGPDDALERFEYRDHSQNGEDGILDAIFERVGEGRRVLLEVGAADGEENCTRHLIERGWSGAWVEADEAKARAAASVTGDRVTVIDRPAEPHGIVDELFAKGVSPEIDLMVIDIDGNDWWVLGSLLERIRTRVLVAEYNGAFPPGHWWVMSYDRESSWTGTVRYGASLDALVSLAARNGLRFLGCDSGGVNAFFAHRDEQLEDLSPTTVRRGYVPPWFGSTPWGHPRRPQSGSMMAPLGEPDLDRVALSRPLRLRHDQGVIAGQPVGMTVKVTNHSSTTLGSGGKYALHLAARWKRGEAAEPWGAQRRVKLPVDLRPGESCRVALWAKAPLDLGAVELEGTIVQESNSWLYGRSPSASVSTSWSVTAEHDAARGAEERRKTQR